MGQGGNAGERNGGTEVKLKKLIRKKAQEIFKK
jgi:hypothetical protein